MVILVLFGLVWLGMVWFSSGCLNLCGSGNKILRKYYGWQEMRRGKAEMKEGRDRNEGGKGWKKKEERKE